MIYIFSTPLKVSPKKVASETFGTDTIFCSPHCGVIIQRRSDLKMLSYSQENPLSGDRTCQTFLHDLDINNPVKL